MIKILAVIGALLFLRYLPGLIVLGVLGYVMLGVFKDLFNSEGFPRSGGSSDEFGPESEGHWHGTGNPWM